MIYFLNTDFDTLLKQVSYFSLFSRKSAKEKINCLIFDCKKTLNEQSSTLRTDKERKGFLKKITDLTKFGYIISNLEPQNFYWNSIPDFVFEGELYLSVVKFWEISEFQWSINSIKFFILFLSEFGEKGNSEETYKKL